VGDISAPTVSRQLKPGVTQYRFSLLLRNYIHVYRYCLNIGFLFFVALLLLKCYWKALSIFTSLYVLDQGLRVILNII
jgi:hypothetical protein